MLHDDASRLAAVGGPDDGEISSSSRPLASPHRRYRRSAALTALVMSLGTAAAVLYYGGSAHHDNKANESSAQLIEEPKQSSLRDPAVAPTIAEEVAKNVVSEPPIVQHFIEDPPVDTSSFHNPLPDHAADVSAWSELPVESPEEHTLGYPFVAACTKVTEDLRPLANRMAGEFDILDAFPNEQDQGLFGPGEKTWTYAFLLHDAEDFEFFLSFELPYVPDLVQTRDFQDSRIGITHEHDDGLPAPGRRRRLAKPACDDGTCRKTCGECPASQCSGNTCQECTSFCGYSGSPPPPPPPPGPGPGPSPGPSPAECNVVTPIDFNALFTPGQTGSYPGISSYSCYRTVAGTNATVDDLVAAYPTLAEKIVLDGYPTIENGYFLYVLKLTDQNFNPSTVNPTYGAKGVVYATSSIHSREFAPAETMTRFAEYLLQNAASDPDIDWILKWNEIHLILHANPDGRKYDEVAKDFWRKNRNQVSPCSASSNYGVDLNRNFPFKHNGCLESGCSSGTCSSETFRGPGEGSEQETKAIVEYAKTIFPEGQRRGAGSLVEAEAQAPPALNTPFPEDNTGVFMDVHSYGGYVGYAWGFVDQRSGNDDGLGALGRKMASYNEYRLWAPEMPANQYPVDGDTLDTMYGWMGAAGLFWELGTAFYQSCSSFPGIINEAFPGLLYAAKVAKAPFVTSKGPDIMCVNFNGAPGALEGNNVVATLDVSDDLRAKHNDDGTNVIFTTGTQNIASVEAYVDCHPNEGCAADSTVSVSGSTTVNVDISFLAPAGEGDHVVYFRGVDSAGYAGAVTAKTFTTCAAAGGCPWTPVPSPGPQPAPTTSSPVATPAPVPLPVCSSNNCNYCSGSKQCRDAGCNWAGGCS